MGEVWNAAFPYIAALLPTIGVAFLFYHIMKYILEGDRRERLAQARWEREQASSPTREHPEAGGIGRPSEGPAAASTAASAAATAAATADDPTGSDDSADPGLTKP